ncbi:MAG: hypothetical protein JWN04_6877 [Myxococcaceae bacterium]|nr:hypothetical protein [Myxococcaceae bacterium]
MASALDMILDIVKRKVSEQAGGSGRGAGVLGQLTNMLGQRSNQAGKSGRVRPASEDPYGDPADQKGAAKVKPASQDPYGDPADK